VAKPFNSVVKATSLPARKRETSLSSSRKKPHSRFKRQENDLLIDVEVDLLKALAGGEFAIKHLDDRALLVKIEPGEVIKHGELKVITGQGMPSQRHHEPGDMYVKLSVVFPDTIALEDIPHLEKALPPRVPVETFEPHITVDEVSLHQTDVRSAPREYQEDAMDEDSEPRVQCANQ